MNSEQLDVLGSLPAGAPNSDVFFMKYTSFGNTFIIVDEIKTPLAGDDERAEFARWVLNGDFGIGGTDNVLYLSRAGGPTARDGDVVFRIFEQDGSETLSCGNGLLSTAACLHRCYGGTQWSVLTELPTGRPRPVQVGVGDTPDETWLNVGRPRAVPAELFRRPGDPPPSQIDNVEDLIVPLPPDAAWAEGLPEKLILGGSLVFTGEPHLALFSGSGFPAVLEDHLFLRSGGTGAGVIGFPASAAMSAGNSLVDHVGHYVNEHYQHLFPQGVHLNFARVLDPAGVIEYRTYERAINCETLACGSGAVAMAYVAQKLGHVAGTDTVFWPHRCRWYQPDAALGVRETPEGYVLSGRPQLVCAGLATRRFGLPVNARL